MPLPFPYPTDGEQRATSDRLAVDIPLQLSILLPLYQMFGQDIAPAQAVLTWGILVLTVLGAVLTLALATLLVVGVFIFLDGVGCVFTDGDTPATRTYWAQLRQDVARLDRLRLRLLDQHYTPFVLEWAADGVTAAVISERLNDLCHGRLFSDESVSRWLDSRIEAERRHQAAVQAGAERERLLRAMVVDLEKKAADA